MHSEYRQQNDKELKRPKIGGAYLDKSIFQSKHHQPRSTNNKPAYIPLSGLLVKRVG